MKVYNHKILFSDPRIMKILMGLLGYSCKVHRKRSRVSFSEDRRSQPPPVKQSSSNDTNASDSDIKGGADNHRASDNTIISDASNSDANKDQTHYIHPGEKAHCCCFHPVPFTCNGSLMYNRNSSRS